MGKIQLLNDNTKKYKEFAEIVWPLAFPHLKWDDSKDIANSFLKKHELVYIQNERSVAGLPRGSQVFIDGYANDKKNKVYRVHSLKFKHMKDVAVDFDDVGRVNPLNPFN